MLKRALTIKMGKNVEKKIANFNKIPHPKGRKVAQLSKKTIRAAGRAKVKLLHEMKVNILGEKILWFKENLCPVEKYTPELTLDLIRRLVLCSEKKVGLRQLFAEDQFEPPRWVWKVLPPWGSSLLLCEDVEYESKNISAISYVKKYLSRFDAELRQIQLKHSTGNRKNRQHANREDIINMTIKNERDEFLTSGIEMPDVLNSKQLNLLKNWSGELRYLQNFTLVRYTKSKLENMKHSPKELEEGRQTDNEPGTEVNIDLNSFEDGEQEKVPDEMDVES